MTANELRQLIASGGRDALKFERSTGQRACGRDVLCDAKPPTRASGDQASIRVVAGSRGVAPGYGAVAPLARRNRDAACA